MASYNHAHNEAHDTTGYEKDKGQETGRSAAGEEATRNDDYTPNNARYGLRSIRERLELFDSLLTIDSGVGLGTRVMFDFACYEADEAESEGRG